MNNDAEIRITEDGSPTIYLPHLDEHYHSIHGALQESMHVFIAAGLEQIIKLKKKHIAILEIGLGTGLNVLLSVANRNRETSINYTALEPFPVEAAIAEQLKFGSTINDTDFPRWYKNIHISDYNKEIFIEPDFTFIKYHQGLEEIQFHQKFDLIYFDAFSPKVQPDIWSAENFQKLYAATNSGGILVTYCAKGSVRRNMIAAGFTVERLQGPPGKREMLRAAKAIKL